MLLRLQGWVLDKAGKNGKAAVVVRAGDPAAPVFPPRPLLASPRDHEAACASQPRLPTPGSALRLRAQVLQQHVTWLSGAIEGLPPPTPADALQAMHGIVSILVWGSRYGHASLCEQCARYFSADAPRGAHRAQLSRAQVRGSRRHAHAAHADSAPSSRPPPRLPRASRAPCRRACLVPRAPALCLVPRPPHHPPASPPADVAPAQDTEGHSVLHALVLGGQAQACRELLQGLPGAEAAALARRRNAAGLLATELAAEGASAAAVSQAALELSRLLPPLLASTSEPAPPPPPASAAASAASAAASSTAGRGGAVRRARRGSDSGSGAPQPMDVSEGQASSDESKAAAAAGDLLQLAAAASSVPSSATPGRARSGQAAARTRDAKPYQRKAGRGGGRGGREEPLEGDCWLPGGFWWRDNPGAMPSGRQPGELAGWAPLAGELTQQRDQEHKQALSTKEHFIQTLGSRDDAAAYLQQLREVPLTREPSDGAVPITKSVDDLDIRHATAWKQLASWGGFRRHFVEEGKEEDGQTGGESGSTAAHPTATSGMPSMTPAMMPGMVPPPPEAWKQQLQEQLLAKRAEVMATQRKLESLSLEQQELELLFKRTL